MAGIDGASAGPARPVLFIQGGGPGTHDAWDDKLVASLQRALGQGFEVRYPRMPEEDDPRFAAWSAVVEREIARLGDGAILVGHSIGGTILIHAVARAPRLLGGVAAICLIASPFVGDGGWTSDDIEPGRDWAEPLSGVAVLLYRGDADETTPLAHLGLYASAIPHALVRRLAGRDHQLGDDLTEVAEDIRRLVRPA
jgi:predicted alpha/beta hydrolase family esterase